MPATPSRKVFVEPQHPPEGRFNRRLTRPVDTAIAGQPERLTNSPRLRRIDPHDLIMRTPEP
ncbi:MAG: hypothetical protein AAGA92_07080 [Planctomycetota bacterium]